MNGEKARQFVAELKKLQEKYQISLSANYEEELDYEYDETPFVSGINTYLVLIDEEGLEIPLDDFLNGQTNCLYCSRTIDWNEDNMRLLCNEGCKTKYQKRMERTDDK